jgi:hypothetical protein
MGCTISCTSGEYAFLPRAELEALRRPAPERPPLSAQDVEDYLARARALRVPGVTGGVYGPRGLLERREPEPALPTLRSRGARERFALARSDEEFARRLLKELPELEGFPLKRYGLFLAGGCAAALLTEPSPGRRYYDDVDFFLVGHAADEGRVEAILALGAHLAARWGGAPTLRRGYHALSFSWPGRPPFQVVLRGYAHLAEVLHGFDLPSCSVGFDGSRLLLTELGALAAERGVNLLCLDGWRPSYSRRLVKYAERGFGLVLPRLSLERAALLPLLRGGRVEARGATLYFDGRPFPAEEGAGPPSSYEGGEASPPAGISYRNASCLVGAGAPRLAGLVALGPFEGAASLHRLAEFSDGLRAFERELSENPPESFVRGPLAPYAGSPELGALVARALSEIGRLREQHPGGYRIPLVFRGVAADTLLTPESGRVSEAAWYGLALAPA